jgi:hypothetical protein
LRQAVVSLPRSQMVDGFETQVLTRSHWSHGCGWGWWGW